MRGETLDSDRRSRRWRLGPVAVSLSIVTLLSVVAPYGIAISGPVGIASAAEPTSIPAVGNITVSGHYALDGDYSGAIEITADDADSDPYPDGDGHYVTTDDHHDGRTGADSVRAADDHVQSRPARVRRSGRRRSARGGRPPRAPSPALMGRSRPGSHQ